MHPSLAFGTCIPAKCCLAQLFHAARGQWDKFVCAPWITVWVFSLITEKWRQESGPRSVGSVEKGRPLSWNVDIEVSSASNWIRSTTTAELSAYKKVLLLQPCGRSKGPCLRSESGNELAGNLNWMGWKVSIIYPYIQSFLHWFSSETPIFLC